MFHHASIVTGIVSQIASKNNSLFLRFVYSLATFECLNFAVFCPKSTFFILWSMSPKREHSVLQCLFQVFLEPTLEFQELRMSLRSLLESLILPSFSVAPLESSAVNKLWKETLRCVGTGTQTWLGWRGTVRVPGTAASQAVVCDPGSFSRTRPGPCSGSWAMSTDRKNLDSHLAKPHPD